MTRKLAIMGTNACADVEWASSGHTVIARTPSQKLLSCLLDGYEVVIITTRTSLNETDKGWSDLILPENIYLPGELVSGGYANDPGLIEPWKKVFERFGLTPPEQGDSWLDWMYAAQDQGVRR